MVKRFTTAPVSYDGFGTVRVKEVGKANKKTVWEVEIKEDALYWQEMRYGSGMELCLDSEKFNEFVEMGIITLVNE